MLKYLFFFFCIKCFHIKFLFDGIILIRFRVIKKVNKDMTSHSKNILAFLLFKAQLQEKGRSPCHWARTVQSSGSTSRTLLVLNYLYWLVTAINIEKNQCNFSFIIWLFIFYRAKHYLIISCHFPLFFFCFFFFFPQHNMWTWSTFPSIKSYTIINQILF